MTDSINEKWRDQPDKAMETVGGTTSRGHQWEKPDKDDDIRLSLRTFFCVEGLFLSKADLETMLATFDD